MAGLMFCIMIAVGWIFIGYYLGASTFLKSIIFNACKIRNLVVMKHTAGFSKYIKVVRMQLAAFKEIRWIKFKMKILGVILFLTTLIHGSYLSCNAGSCIYVTLFLSVIYAISIVYIASEFILLRKLIMKLVSLNHLRVTILRQSTPW